MNNLNGMTQQYPVMSSHDIVNDELDTLRRMRSANYDCTELDIDGLLHEVEPLNEPMLLTELPPQSNILG